MSARSRCCFGATTRALKMCPAGSTTPPPHVTDLQLRVVDAITRQLETGRHPTPELTKLFRELMAWAKQPVSEDSAAESDHTATTESGDAESERPNLGGGGTARRRD